MINLYDDLEARGIIKQTTSPDFEKILRSDKKLTLYAGFDPTSDSLHIGSLLPIITLMRFQKHGHRTLALVGGATGMIGDPSGRAQERNLLTEEALKHNLNGISQILSQFIDLKDPKKGALLNNADWFKPFTFLGFLRDVGKHFSVNMMMNKDSVKSRLEDREQGISYTEFSYMLLQAYDFYHLNQTQGCNLQIGGSDQWGNITAGIDLTRRMKAHGSSSENSKELDLLYGMTHPLVMKADGTKFGKSESGAIWLSAHKTSPYEFYQYFIQCSDADVITFLKYFTFLSLEEIKELESLTLTEPEKRIAQKKLAEELTQLVHGEEALLNAVNASKSLFSEDLKSLSLESIEQVFKGAPQISKPVTELGTLTLVDCLVEGGLCASKGAARKDIQGGGIYLNNTKVSDATLVLNKEDLIASRAIVLRKGKKTNLLVLFS